MKRLPHYDKNTGWLELGAYLALGLAGATLTGLSFFNGMTSVSQTNPVAGPVSSQHMHVVNEKSEKATSLLVTNANFVRPPSSAGRAPPAGAVAAPQGKARILHDSMSQKE
jgi:hypothetical protein